MAKLYNTSCLDEVWIEIEKVWINQNKFWGVWGPMANILGENKTFDVNRECGGFACQKVSFTKNSSIWYELYELSLDLFKLFWVSVLHSKRNPNKSYGWRCSTILPGKWITVIIAFLFIFSLTLKTLFIFLDPGVLNPKKKNCLKHRLERVERSC